MTSTLLSVHCRSQHRRSHRLILVAPSHFHPDHAGSALGLAGSWACPVYLDPDELPLANGDFAAMTRYAGPLDHWIVLPLMRAMGRRRREAMLAASSLSDVSRSYEPDAGVPGLPAWECIPAPGHVSFFRASDRVVITGAAAVTLKVNSLSGLLLGRQGLSGPPRYTSWSWRAAKESVGKLALLGPNVLGCGHGTAHDRSRDGGRLANLRPSLASRGVTGTVQARPSDPVPPGAFWCRLLPFK